MKTIAILRGSLIGATLLIAAPLWAADASPKSQDFVMSASAASIGEIETAKLALQKSQSTDVKTFAQHIIDDHTKANTELKKLAQDNNLKISDDPSMGDQAKAKVLNIRDESFDAAYANNQVNAHEEAVKLFKDAAENADDPEIKQFAQATLPVLQQHLEMAQQLAKAHPSE
ncbi:hypothetical protein D3C76_640050 [compost metagenome]